MELELRTEASPVAFSRRKSGLLYAVGHVLVDVYQMAEERFGALRGLVVILKGIGLLGIAAGVAGYVAMLFVAIFAAQMPAEGVAMVAGVTVAPVLGGLLLYLLGQSLQLVLAIEENTRRACPMPDRPCDSAAQPPPLTPTAKTPPLA